jgi:hypothetical protein
MHAPDPGANLAAIEKRCVKKTLRGTCRADREHKI